jgi:hypothetical protein
MNNNNINRKFGLIVGGACLCVFIFKLVFKHPHYLPFAILGGILMLTALIIPQILNPLRVVWDKIGEVLGIINSHVILFLLYFIIITPIGFLLRLMNKDLLKTKIINHKNTYWETMAPVQGSTLKQQF